MRVPLIEKTLGLKTYASQTPGIGGTIRVAIEDFTVQEVLVDGSVASVERQAERKALGASDHKQHFLICILIKRNWDNLRAMSRIAMELGISQTEIKIAGIKDARAVTAQHITIEGISAETVAKIKVRDIEVYPVGYFRDELAPFYLLGNKFRIRIRRIKHEEADVEKRIVETIGLFESTGGFPNFFGHQRFGTKRPITHIVGRSIVKGDFEEAAMLFLTQPSKYEHPESGQARSDLRSTHNFKHAIRDFPRQLRYERIMLNHLAEEPDDFVGAFRCLPQKLQELFVQAYQSYLFNLFLSERLRGGFSLNKAESGDYVVRIEHTGLPIGGTGKIVNSETLTETNDAFKAGRIRVAMPLIGVKQKPSEGSMGEIQREILEAEGIEPKNFRVDALRIMSGNGGLRAIVSPVKGFTVQNVTPSEDDSKTHETELSFMLLRGSYATMLLREIMKPHDPISSGF